MTNFTYTNETTGFNNCSIAVDVADSNVKEGSNTVKFETFNQQGYTEDSDPISFTFGKF